MVAVGTTRGDVAMCWMCDHPGSTTDDYVSPQRAARLLNIVGERSVRDGPPRPGDQIDIRPGPILEVVEVEHPDAQMNCAAAICGSEVRALQLVWADEHGRWPWRPGFNDGRGRQPVLGLRATVD
ncbi:DUF4262 domain-containing protein [uncultured Mycobacterium sp.]|uniref:DUF4262 domain-containing protein n=1 Tax=uncultured Mycobacterium sp. TaxID=171292 RepID=UPI0035C9E006